MQTRASSTIRFAAACLQGDSPGRSGNRVPQSYSGSDQHSCLVVMSTLQIVKMRSALPGGDIPDV